MYSNLHIKQQIIKFVQESIRAVKQYDQFSARIIVELYDLSLQYQYITPDDLKDEITIIRNFTINASWQKESYHRLDTSKSLASTISWIAEHDPYITQGDIFTLLCTISKLNALYTIHILQLKDLVSLTSPLLHHL